MTTQLLQQALDALEPISAYGRVGTKDVEQAKLQQVCAALREAIAAPQAEPVAWKCARCGNTSDCEGVTAGDNWCNSCAVCGEMRPLYATPPAPQASPVPDGMVMVPREIIDRFPEINPSNYDHDDACALNAWGVEVVLAASPAAPAAPVVPLTDSELAKIAVEDEFLLYCDQDSFNEIARAIEAAHGITGASK